MSAINRAREVTHHWSVSRLGPSALHPSALRLDCSQAAEMERVVLHLENGISGAARALLIEGKLNASPLRLVQSMAASARLAGMDADAIARCARQLIRVLQAGAKAGLFRIASLPRVSVRQRKSEGISAQAPDSHMRISRLTRYLHVRQPSALTHEEVRGHLALSLILQNRLINPRQLHSVWSRLREPLLARGSFHYCEYLSEDPVRGRTFMRRTNLLPLPAVLSMKRLERKDSLPAESVDALWPSIRAFLRGVGCPREEIPRSLSRLLRDAKYASQLELPPYAVAYLAGHLLTSEAPESSQRLAEGLSARWLAPTRQLALIPRGRREENMRPIPNLGGWCEDLLQPLALATSDHDAREALYTIRVGALDSPSPQALGLLVEWGVQMLQGEGAGPIERRYKIVRRGICVLGPIFVDVVNLSSNKKNFTARELADLADSLNEEILDLPDRGTILQDVARLIQFLGARAGLNDEFIPKLSPMADANVFGPLQIADLLCGIEESDASMADKELQRLFVGLGLLGPRPSETYWLRSEDVGPAFIRICWSEYRRLKSRSSARNIPVALIAPQFAHLLTKATKHARRGSRFVMSDKDACRGSEAKVLAPLSRILKMATGNPSARPHHWRHTLASSLALGVAFHVHGLTRLDGQLGDLQEWLNRGKDFCDAILTSPAAPANFLFAIAIVLGHSGPHVTLEHYIHVIDLIVFALLEQRVAPAAKGALVAACEASRSTACRLREASATRSVSYVENERTVLRDDSPRVRPESFGTSHKFYKWIVSWHLRLSAGAMQANEMPIWRAAGERSRFLDSIPGSKSGSSLNRHRMTEAATPLPAPLQTNEARRAAKIVADCLERALTHDLDNAIWALEHFALHAQRTKPRVSFKNSEDMNKFLRIKGLFKGIRKQWGSGVRTRKRLRRHTVEGLWVSLAPSGSRFSSQGAIFVWQMAYILIDQLKADSLREPSHTNAFGF